VIWTITQDTPLWPSSTTFDHNSAKNPKLQERFVGEVAQEAVQRTERTWQQKLKPFKDVA
jgi:hypothetical protein